MLLYHGSNLAVERPRLIKQNRFLDFGYGFYTTSNLQQAVDFSHKVVRRERTGGPIVSVYEIDETMLEDGLAVLRFDSPGEAWLDFVASQRTGTYQGPLYDLIVGPVANDNVYRTLTFYMAGALSKAQALEALKIQELFDQYVWASTKALEKLAFVESLPSEEVAS